MLREVTQTEAAAAASAEAFALCDGDRGAFFRIFYGILGQNKIFSPSEKNVGRTEMPRSNMHT
jgi:hypothetical protein